MTRSESQRMRQGKHTFLLRTVCLRLAVAVLLFALPACQQEMATQPSYRPLEGSDFFADGRASRPLVPGTVARGQLRTDSVLYTGRDAEGKRSEEFPFPMTRDVLDRGKERFGIFCSMCHGLTGHGDGRIVQRGFTPPPNLITDNARSYAHLGEKKKLIDVPPGYLFEVITRGYGAMPSHAEQIPVRDRWAIAGYVRALQYSQSAELRQRVEKGGKK